MRAFWSFVWTLFVLALVGLVAWLLRLDDVVRTSLEAGHWLDWLMGALCLIWLGVVLKVPWDLYFQAQMVTFELHRSQERGVALVSGREEYIRGIRRRLGWLAVGAHVASALLVAGITYFTGGAVGYFFAVFYLVSTVFRPAVAGYVYLSEKLHTIAEEARYPREDVVELRQQVELHHDTLRNLQIQMEAVGDALSQERTVREAETRELRHTIHAVGRELETTIARLTDNQEIIRGIRAFVRLVTQPAEG